jgi:LysM repeat protein
MMNKVFSGIPGRLLFMLPVGLLMGGLLLAACAQIPALRNIGQAGIATPAPDAQAVPPPAPNPAVAAAPTLTPAAAAQPAPTAQAQPAQAQVIAPTVQPVIVTEEGEVVIAGQGIQASAQRQETTGISPAPIASDGVTDATCGQRVEHVVSKGQTLFAIARFYRANAWSLARINNISNVRRIAVGTRLTVVTCDGAGAAGAPASRRRYVVRPGDTMYRIGVRFGRSAESIRSANGLPNFDIRPGQVLVIP